LASSPGTFFKKSEISVLTIFPPMMNICVLKTFR
jgi:hypothetical protein